MSLRSNNVEFEPPMPWEKEFGTTFPSGGSGGGGAWPWNRPSPTTPNQGVQSPSTLPSTQQPYSEFPGAAGMSGGGAAGGASGGLAGLLAGLTAKDWLALAAAAAGITGAARSNSSSMAPNTLTDDPQLKELLGLMKGRIQKSEPLHDSILSMANGLLPTQYQRDNPLLRSGG